MYIVGRLVFRKCLKLWISQYQSHGQAGTQNFKRQQNSHNSDLVEKDPGTRKRLNYLRDAEGRSPGWSSQLHLGMRSGRKLARTYIWLLSAPRSQGVLNDK